MKRKEATNIVNCVVTIDCYGMPDIHKWQTTTHYITFGIGIMI